MATITHLNWLDLMLGGGIHTIPDFSGDNIDFSLLDQTDAGTITSAFVDYAEVAGAVVVATTDIPGIASTTGGVLTMTAPTTFNSVSGDIADYLTAWKNITSDAVSPLIITWDSASSGLPVTPNTGNIIATWGSNVLVTLA